MKHPRNKLQRSVVEKKISEKKQISGNSSRDGEGHIRKRLLKENIKEQETHDELKEYQGH